MAGVAGGALQDADDIALVPRSERSPSAARRQSSAAPRATTSIYHPTPHTPSSACDCDHGARQLSRSCTYRRVFAASGASITKHRLGANRASAALTACSAYDAAITGNHGGRTWWETTTQRTQRLLRGLLPKTSQRKPTNVVAHFLARRRNRLTHTA